MADKSRFEGRGTRDELQGSRFKVQGSGSEEEKSLPPIPDRFRLSREFRLLVACSWIAPAAYEKMQEKQIISLLEEGIDWDLFITLVDRHRVPALAYAALQRFARELLPKDVREKLKERSDHARREALRYAAELIRLLKIFAEQGIDVIPLKGVMLSLRLYGDIGMRQMKDLDLLVKLDDLERANRLLKSEGYRCTSPGDELTSKQKKHHLKIGQNYEYINDKSRLDVELHWRSYFWTMDQAVSLWNSCDSIELMGEKISCLNDQESLLFLCYHGANHKWFRLKWLGDVAVQLSKVYPPEWAKIIDTAAHRDEKRVLAQTALLVHWLYGVQLPEPLHNLIEKERLAKTLGLKAIEFLLMNDEELILNDKRLEGLRHSCYLKRLLPSLPIGLILKRSLINYSDFKELSLPDPLFWLYCPLRPVFWLWRHYIKALFKVKNKHISP